MVVMLLVLAFYDLKWMILPDRVMLPLIVVAFLYALVEAVVQHSSMVLADRLVAAVVAGGAFYALVFFSKGRATVVRFHCASPGCRDVLCKATSESNTWACRVLL